MPCAIMQFKKIAASGINLSQRHNERRKFRPKDISDSRYSRYANDYHIINSDMPYTAFMTSSGKSAAAHAKTAC